MVFLKLAEGGALLYAKNNALCVEFLYLKNNALSFMFLYTKILTLCTFLMFADLFKAFYTSNHKLIVEILKKYGCPHKLCSSIRSMYTDNKVSLILGKIDISIPFEVGVKQGDSVAPVLFLFIMMAFLKSLEK